QVKTTHSTSPLSFSKQTFHFESDIPSNSVVSSSTNSAPSGSTLFSGFGNNIVNSFKGNNLYLHLAGVASTFVLVTTNTDYEVHKFFNENEQYSNAARPVIHWAIYVPFAVGGSLYAYGKVKHDDEAMGASFAVFQASLIAF
ncbi:MAG: hypothetical protein M0P61_03580, partial [Ignavibacteriaceae bacterium]|nr:hypothetical protein [Ignavibacteriaceae bacterium]